MHSRGPVGVLLMAGLAWLAIPACAEAIDAEGEGPPPTSDAGEDTSLPFDGGGGSPGTGGVPNTGGVGTGGIAGQGGTAGSAGGGGTAGTAGGATGGSPGTGGVGTGGVGTGGVGTGGVGTGGVGTGGVGTGGGPGCGTGEVCGAVQCCNNRCFMGPIPFGVFEGCCLDPTFGFCGLVEHTDAGPECTPMQVFLNLWPGIACYPI